MPTVGKKHFAYTPAGKAKAKAFAKKTGKKVVDKTETKFPDSKFPSKSKKVVSKNPTPPAGGPVGYQSPPIPPNLMPQAAASTPIAHPMIPMSPAMMNSIKQSPKGQIPPGLARYLAAKRAAKGGM